MRTIKFNEYNIVRETETSLSKTQARTKIIQVHKPNSQMQRHQYAHLTLMLQPGATKPFLLIEGECGAYMTSQPGSYPIHIVHIQMIIVSISSRVQK